MTHRILISEGRDTLRVGGGLIRISLGMQREGDLLDDLINALNAVANASEKN